MSCCGNCLKIQILDTIAGFPDSLKVDGKILLDYREGFYFELTKAAAELTELSEINDEAVLESSLPYTPANLKVAELVRNHNRFNEDYSPLNCLIQEGSRPHTFDTLEITGTNDDSGDISIRLKRSTQHWLTKAEKQRLYELDFGEFEFNEVNLRNNWANQAEYDPDSPTSDGVYFPLVHYGGWMHKSEVVVEDFRPWFHLYAILKKGFCQLGWNFESPFLDTTFGRRLITYLSGNQYGRDTELLPEREFSAQMELLEGTVFLGFLVFDIENFDNGNNYDETTGQFSGAGIFDFFMGVEFYAVAVEDNEKVTLELRRRLLSGEQETIQSAQVNLAEVDGRIEVSLEANDVAVLPGQTIYGYLYRRDIAGGTFSEVDGYFYNRAKRVYPASGDILELGQLINRQLTVLDALKGYAHLIGGKIVTSWNTRTVTVYQPYEAEIYSEQAEGFYHTDQFRHFGEEIVVDSEAVALSRIEKERELLLAFSSDEDALVENENFPEDEPVFSKLLDRGENFEEGREENRNPLFAPTITRGINRNPAYDFSNANVDVHAPHLWDNTDGAISFDLSPRILYCAGIVEQGYTARGSNLPRRFKFEGVYETLVPFAFQETTVQELSGGELVPFDRRLVYGSDDNGNDLYTIGYQKEVIRQLFGVRSSLLIFITQYEYESTDFRDLYRIYYNGRTFTARLQEITGYKTCSPLPTTMIFSPEPFVGDTECDDVIIKDGRGYKDQACASRPEISIDIDVGADSITADADDTAMKVAPVSDTWEQSTDGGETWTAYTPGTALTGVADVIFRRTVSFDDGCPDEIAVKRAIFETACNNLPGIKASYDPATNEAIAVADDGEINSTIDTDTWVIEVDGAAAIPYTPGDPVTGFTEEVVFTRTVTFTGTCDEKVVSEAVQAQTPICNNSPEIIFTELAAGACIYDLSIGGTITSNIFATSFYISYDGGTTYQAWDNQPVKARNGIKVRAIVHYTGECGPDTIEADCPVS